MLGAEIPFEWILDAATGCDSRTCFVVQLALVEQEIDRRAIIEDSLFGWHLFKTEILMTMARAAIQLLM
jgi:hypothetical protein